MFTDARKQIDKRYGGISPYEAERLDILAYTPQARATVATPLQLEVLQSKRGVGGLITYHLSVKTFG